MTAAIKADVSESVLQHNGVDAVPFDASGLKIGAFADGVITGPKLAADVPFRASFTSAEQTITSAGTLSIAHGLGSSPALIQVKLICKIAELGYSIGDEVVVNPAANNVSGALANRGVSCILNATNIIVRYANSAAVFEVVDAATGGTAQLTNGNWRMVVGAFA